MKDRKDDISDVSDIGSTGQFSEAEAKGDQIGQSLNRLDDSSMIVDEINCSLFDKSFSDQVINMNDNIKKIRQM